MRPVSFYCAIPGFFRLSIDSVGTKHPKKHRPKRGQGLKPSTRAKAKGQSRMVPPGGFSRGEQFERERVAPPLSRLLCVLSCRGKKVRPRWQALAENRLEKRLKGYNRVSITTSKYYPTANRQFAPRLLPQSPAVTAPSRRELWGLSFATLGFWIKQVPAVESLSHASGVPAPFDKGAFGCTADTGRVREVTNRRKLPCVLTAAARRLWLVPFTHPISSRCRSTSRQFTAYTVPAPFRKGTFGSTDDTGHF